MYRSTSNALAALILALLLVSLVLQVWSFPSEVRAIVTTFPEVAFLAGPGIAWGVLAIACWQAVGIMALRVVAHGRHHRFDLTTRRWLRAIIGVLAVFVALVVAAFVTLATLGYTTPGAMYGLIFAGLVAAATAVSIGLFLGTRLTLPQYLQA